MTFLRVSGGRSRFTGGQKFRIVKVLKERSWLHTCWKALWVQPWFTCCLPAAGRPWVTSCTGQYLPSVRSESGKRDSNKFYHVEVIRPFFKKRKRVFHRPERVRSINRLSCCWEVVQWIATIFPACLNSTDEVTRTLFGGRRLRPANSKIASRRKREAEECPPKKKNSSEYLVWPTSLTLSESRGEGRGHGVWRWTPGSSCSEILFSCMQWRACRECLPASHLQCLHLYTSFIPSQVKICRSVYV